MWRWVFLLLLVGLGGCARGAGTASSPSPAASPQRIVSLTPNLTEILFALGAGPNVVGVTRNDSYPPEVRTLPKVGDMVVDWESLVRLKPDRVVLDRQLNREHLERLEQLGLPARGFESQSLKGMKAAVTELAAELHQTKRGQELLIRLEGQLEAARQKQQKWPKHPRVFVEIWWEPLMSAGGKTYVDEVLEAAGGSNCCSQFIGQYPAINTEKLLELDPDFILLTTVEPTTAATRAGWSQLRAVKAGRVYRISEDLLVRPTLRLPLGVQQLQSWFEPWALEDKGKGT